VGLGPMGGRLMRGSELGGGGGWLCDPRIAVRAIRRRVMLCVNGTFCRPRTHLLVSSVAEPAAAAAAAAVTPPRSFCDSFSGGGFRYGIFIVLDRNMPYLVPCLLGWLQL